MEKEFTMACVANFSIPASHVERFVDDRQAGWDVFNPTRIYASDASLLMGLWNVFHSGYNSGLRQVLNELTGVHNAGS